MSKKRKIGIAILCLGIIAVAGSLTMSFITHNISSMLSPLRIDDEESLRENGVSIVLTDEEKITAVYWALEKSKQTGDGNRFSLYDETYLEKFLGKNDTLRKKYEMEGVPPQPSVKFGEPTKVIVREDEAAIFGSETRTTASNETLKTYSAFRLAKQSDREWKITFESIGDSPIVPATFFPLKRGIFAQSNYPWNTTPYADMATDARADGFPWKMQSAYDETYLYVRLESSKKLPALGTEFKDALFDQFKPDVPLIGVFVSGQNVVSEKRGYFSAGNGERTTAKFGKDGKATENKYYSEYNVLVMNLDNDHLLDSTATDGTFITFDEIGNALILAMPLELFGVTEGSSNPEHIVLEEFNSMKKFLPYEAKRF